MLKPKVLVLLASHNGAPWIEEQVASILAQLEVSLCLVIGDDQSNDDTLARLKERWGDDRRVSIVLFERSSGSAGASFRRLICAVDASGFDAIALADQDDLWHHNKLAIATARLLKDGSAAYSAAVTARWPDGREVLLRQRAAIRRADFLFEGAGQGCTFVLRRDFFERTQQFLHGDETHGLNMHFHDWMLYVLSRAWDLRWSFDPQPRMTYRQHGGNEIGGRGRLGGTRRRLQLIASGWYAQQVASASATYCAAGGRDPSVLSLIHGLENRTGRGRLDSLKLVVAILRGGRRRLSDRSVQVLAVLLRYL